MKAKLDRIQRAHAWLAIPYATVKKFSEDNAGTFAAVLAFYGFFSFFPLLLVFTTVLGFVLAGDPSTLHSVQDSVLGHFPVIGETISGKGLRGSVPALVIGSLLSLWSGLGVTGSAEQAVAVAWGVPKRERFSYIGGKLRGVMLLATIGGLFVIASCASGLVTGGLGGPLLLVAGVLVSLIVNFCLFMISFQLLCSERIEWRDLIPGSLVAALLWEVLQVTGGAYIGHFKHSSDAYGTFALVIGILAWLHLGTQMTMYCAEFNTVIAKHLWPRAIGDDSEASDGSKSKPQAEV